MLPSESSSIIWRGQGAAGQARPTRKHRTKQATPGDGHGRTLKASLKVLICSGSKLLKTLLLLCLGWFPRLWAEPRPSDGRPTPSPDDGIVGWMGVRVEDIAKESVYSSFRARQKRESERNCKSERGWHVVSAHSTRRWRPRTARSSGNGSPISPHYCDCCHLSSYMMVQIETKLQQKHLRKMLAHWCSSAQAGNLKPGNGISACRHRKRCISFVCSYSTKRLRKVRTLSFASAAPTPRTISCGWNCIDKTGWIAPSRAYAARLAAVLRKREMGSSSNMFQTLMMPASDPLVKSEALAVSSLHASLKVHRPETLT